MPYIFVSIKSTMLFLSIMWTVTYQVNPAAMYDHKATAHYDDVIMNAIASQITSLTIVYSIVYSDAHQRKHQSSASLAFVRGIHRGPVNSRHKWPVTRKMFTFDDVIMKYDFLYSDCPYYYSSCAFHVWHTRHGVEIMKSYMLFINPMLQNMREIAYPCRIFAKP